MSVSLCGWAFVCVSVGRSEGFYDPRCTSINMQISETNTRFKVEKKGLANARTVHIYLVGDSDIWQPQQRRAS